MIIKMIIIGGKKKAGNHLNFIDSKSITSDFFFSLKLIYQLF